GVPAQIIAAEYKLQTGAAGADNVALGSLPVGVDTDTGTLGTALEVSDSTGVAHPDRIERCPVSGERFAGVHVPCWEQAVEVALKAAECFPWVRAVGWDIAVTPDGPFIVEGNWAWGHTGAQVGPARGLYHGAFKKVCDRLRAEGRAEKELV
ncbi:MAG: sugar-transfer associated ATP-grasp domain-containing protein, partial [Candidatus Brocadiia bacterium]